ncbi:MAG: PAS domain-containing sensor histidine kinase, partial [Phycisphaerae bacterium]|nr:PAS domain-containing sensor histidine kinase [Phycisphaerae bacterium]
ASWERLVLPLGATPGPVPPKQWHLSAREFRRARPSETALNQAAVALLGLRGVDMKSEPLATIVPEARRPLLNKLLKRMVRRMESAQFDVRVEDNGDAPKDVTVFLAPLSDPAGRIEGVAAWIIDQTRHVQLVHKFNKAEKMASLGTLASGVAHHFNNILGGVATFVDFALTSGDIGAMKRALQMTAEASVRASKLTQSLLSFAKHDSYRADLADLTEVILTFAHLVEKPLGEKNIKLELELHPVSVVAVEANRMHQILGNLLTNAEEAMPDGGTIFLNVGPGKDDSEAILTFADDGAGINAKDIDRVFDPFFTTKGLHAGGERMNPGLGLSVVQGIVLEMGGRIAVSPRPESGTEFVITLPVHSQNDDFDS